MKFGWMHEAQTKLNPATVGALADIFGTGNFCRFVLRWDDETNPSRGVFNFTKALENIAILRAAGTDVYLNSQWAPAWVTGGQPTFVEYVNGSSVWVQPGDPNVEPPIPFDPSKGIRPASVKEKPWAGTGALRPDSGATREWFDAVAKTFGPLIKYASCMNEPGGWIYNPAMAISQDEGLRRMFDDFYMPFVEAFNDYPNVTVIGIEAQGGDEIRRLKAMEQKVFTWPMWDEYGIHYPEEGHAWDEYVKSCQGEPATDTRPIGVTEGGYDDWPMTVSEIQEAQRRGCSRFVIFEAEKWLLGKDGRANAHGAEIRKLTQHAEPAPVTLPDEVYARGLTDLRMWAIERKHGLDDNPENTSMPGAWLTYLLSTYRSAPPEVSNPIIKALATRIDERFQKPAVAFPDVGLPPFKGGGA